MVAQRGSEWTSNLPGWLISEVALPNSSSSCMPLQARWIRHREVSAALDLSVDGIAAARAACFQDFRHRMATISIRTEAEDS
jgi:hypothetical protein